MGARIGAASLKAQSQTIKKRWKQQKKPLPLKIWLQVFIPRNYSTLGVMLSHNNVVSNVIASAERLPLERGKSLP